MQGQMKPHNVLFIFLVSPTILKVSRLCLRNSLALKSSCRSRRSKRSFKAHLIWDRIDYIFWKGQEWNVIKQQHAAAPEVELGLLENQAVAHLRDDFLGGAHGALRDPDVFLGLAARLARFELKVQPPLQTVQKDKTVCQRQAHFGCQFVWFIFSLIWWNSIQDDSGADLQFPFSQMIRSSCARRFQYFNTRRYYHNPEHNIEQNMAADHHCHPARYLKLVRGDPMGVVAAEEPLAALPGPPPPPPLTLPPS